MSAVYTLEDVRVDLPGPRARLGGLLPGPQRRLNLLDGITIGIGPAETLALVGESGSGKTTLARAMLGLVPVSAGRLRFQGGDMADPRATAALRRRSAMVFQDAVASLSPRMRVGSAVSEPFAIHGVPVDRQAKAEELLQAVGLSPALARRYPHELSGGQARRVCVARAIALDPRLLVADEPTAGLDVSVQGEILNLLAGLKERLGLSLLVISHNLSVVRHVADRVAILYLGRLVETGPTDAVFSGPLHPYTHSLIAAQPQPDPRRRRPDLAIRGEIPSLLRRPSGCEFHTRCPLARGRCRAEVPVLRELAPGRSTRCHFPLST